MIKRTIVALLFIVSTLACNRNQLRTNEDQLKKQIHTEEEQLAYERQQWEEHLKRLSDSLAKLPKGLRFT